MKDKVPKVPIEPFTPTNGYAAKRPYCYKHHRAMLDIGGKMQCIDCKRSVQGQERK